MGNPLLKKNRQTARYFTISTGDGETAEVGILKPTVGDRLRVLNNAQAAGELDADGKPTSPLASAHLATRMIVALVTVANGTQAFSEEERHELLDMPYFEELSQAVGLVFAGATQEQVGNG